MLSAAEIGSIFGQITYRPGWLIKVDEDVQGPRVRIVARLQNSYSPEETMEVGVESYVPPCRNQVDFLEWLAWRLQQIEIHESREWFKVNGTVWDDPHEESYSYTDIKE